jgi:alpha-N-arabinofuranosidase
MKKTTSAARAFKSGCLIFVALAQICAAQDLAPAVETTITINAAKPAGWEIPRSIYGTFLEPIGNSIYNGLWAEVLQNPSFEADLWNPQQIADMLRESPELAQASNLGLPLPWEPLNPSQGARYAPERNDTANSSRSLLVMALPGEPTGIRQKVYLPVHRTLRYTGSVYLKLLSGPGRVQVSLRKRNSGVLAAQQIGISGAEWQRYEFKLDVPANQLRNLEPADFVISVEEETRVLVDQASLLPADNVEGMDPDMVAMAKAMKTPVLRFGGNFTSAYHWRDGTGPRDKRLTMLNVAWGIPEYNQFGTDELLEFCRLIGAQPQIALNLGTGTPAEAAGWVSYVNSHWGDHSGGLLWELGNELWADFQVGYPTLPRIAERTRQFSEAVRKVDPKAKLIATGADPDHFQDWNSAQLTNPSGTFDFLSTHFVVTTSSAVAAHPSGDFLARSTFALPVGLERQLRKMHDQIRQQQSPVKTAFTEWLFWSPTDQYPRYDNMAGAIATGSFLNMLLRNADIVPVADMTGIVEFGGMWKKRGRVFGVPAYWAFTMFSNADAAKLLETSTSGESYDVESGITRIPTIPGVPYLDVVAALNGAGDKLTLFCVNRDLGRDLAANIRISGFSSAPKALARSLYADSIYEVNDETAPEHIHPRNSFIAVGGTGFGYTFRHASITVIELTKK